MSNRKKSDAIFKKLKEVIPGGVDSPARAFKGLLETPIVAKRGSGALIYDEDDD